MNKNTDGQIKKKTNGEKSVRYEKTVRSQDYGKDIYCTLVSLHENRFSETSSGVRIPNENHYKQNKNR